MVPKRGLADGDFNFIVDSGLVYLLREKINIVYGVMQIFLKKYALKGLATGMIISDTWKRICIALAQRGKK
jgi:hypothetical protein